MVNKIEYIPSIAIPPGETLKEFLDDLDMSQNELSKRTGISEKHISEIINAKAPISQSTALKFEYVLDVPASFWNNLESNYQETLARIKESEEIEKESYILHAIPYSDMAKKRWIKSAKTVEEKIICLRDFFKVSSLNFLPTVMTAAFRKTEGEKTSNYALAAWLRKGEIEAENVEIKGSFSKSRFKKLVPVFRQLTMEAPEIFYNKLVELCSSCGIALVLVPHIPKTYACGAIQWKDSKAIIQLSVRGAKADIFWFTFFHEVAHILSQEKKQYHIQDSQNNCEDETEIDKIAGDMLIPHEKYSAFVNSGEINRDSILKFAEEIGIAPCMVVGRLQHEKVVGFNQYSDMRPSFAYSSEG